LSIGGLQATYVHVDEVLNDSDKSIVIPTEIEAEILSIYIDYQASADVGVRVPQIQIKDVAGNVVFKIKPNITLNPNDHKYIVLFNGALGNAGDIGDIIQQALPKLFLPSGWTIQIFDSSVIAVAADDMMVYIIWRERYV